MSIDEVRPASGGRAYARPSFVSLEGKALLSFVRGARRGQRAGDTGPYPVVDLEEEEPPSREGAA